MMKLSIRKQLLILAAVATASIWGGALLQFSHLQAEREHLATVRTGLAMGVLYGRFASELAVERGQSYGALLARDESGGQAAFTKPRQNVDAELSALRAGLALQPHAQTALLFRELELARRLADGGGANAALVFATYSGLIGKSRDAAARYLAEGMIEVGLPYEYVTHLNETAEHLAQIRGIVNGVLSAGVLDSGQRNALIEQLTLYREYQHLHTRTAPITDTAGALSPHELSSVELLLEHTQRLIDTGRPDSLGLSSAAWWAAATTSINILLKVASSEENWLAAKAEQRMNQVERQIRFYVVALVVLGVLTLGLALSTVGRIVGGLNALLTGLDGVSSRGNFNTRINVPRGDEFSNISVGINKLIAVAATVVAEREKESATDPLTGLLNRRGLQTQLAARLHPSRGQIPGYSLLAIDIDHFKTINDRYGHPIGDRVLIKLSAVLRERLRDDDLICRSGGEEFLVLLVGCDIAAAQVIAEALRSQVANTDFGLGRPVTVSLGLANAAGREPTDQLISRADQALYQAKSLGRNRVMVAAPAPNDDSDAALTPATVPG